MTFCLGLAIAAMVLALLLTPLVRGVAVRIGAVDRPAARKIHTAPIPRMGGVAIYLAFIAVLGAAWWYHGLTGRGIGMAPRWFEILGVGGLLIVGVGWIDDRRSLSPRTKLLVQTAAAVFVVGCGLVVESLTLPFVGEVHLGLLSIPITVLWIVGITNALNLIDGMDGLGTGVAFIASTCSWLISAYLGDIPSAIFFACLSGACLGFLRYNLHPASIFLGDSGSLFLGFALAVLSIGASTKAATTVSILAPIFVLGLPILDTALAILRRASRARRGKGDGREGASVLTEIFSSDREHIHHRLLWWGFSDRQSVLLLYAACGLMGGLAFACILAKDRGIALILIYVAALFWIGLRRLSFGLSGGAGIRGAELCGRIRLATAGRSALIHHADEKLGEYVEETLAGLGMRTARTATPEEAVAISRSRPFDLVLVDVARGRDAEMHLFERLKELNRGGVFIVLTGFEGFDRAAQALRRGAYDYLENPPNPDRVRYVLNRACERAWLLARARFASSLLWIAVLTIPVAAAVLADLMHR